MSPRIPVRSNQRSRDDRSYDARTSHECGQAQLVFLDTPEAAAFLRISPITLARWRIEGKGPAYRKFGRRVVYARADLMNWADDRRRESTSATSGRRVRDSTGPSGPYRSSSAGHTPTNPKQHNQQRGEC